MCALFSLSVVSDSLTPWTVARQAPLTMGFSKQEHWSGLPSPPPGDLPNSGVEPRSPALQADSLPSEPPGKPIFMYKDKYVWCFPRWHSGKGHTCQCRRYKRRGFDPWPRKIPWSRKWQPTPVLLPENSMDRGVPRATVHGVMKSQTCSSTHEQQQYIKYWIT